MGVLISSDLALIKAACAVVCLRLEQMKLTKKVQGRSAGELLSAVFEHNPEVWLSFVADVKRVANVSQAVRASEPAAANRN